MLRSATSLIQGITTPLTTRTATVWAGQRLFSNTSQCLNQEPPKPTENTAEAQTETEASGEIAEEEPPFKMSHRRKRFHDWIRGAGSKYARPAVGTTNYISNPFPNNPLFQTKPPLSDARRQEIYNVYMTAPQLWTVRKLATKFGLSMKRIDAVLKLKIAEKEMETSGVVLQKKFTKNMEQLMGVDQQHIRFQEPLFDIFPNVGKPVFKALEEDAVFDSKDAADVLNRKQFKILEARAIGQEDKAFTRRLTQENTVPESQLKRGAFVIVDTSQSK
ncbi:eukaryotic mitochondrial regulator protein-domain-containing protein [Spinellus fusiger]|nr:eukaryotic mitochondrial regulator protein-domain-containing protein [Spinellus fusiger]